MPFEMLHSFLVGQLPIKKTTSPSQVNFFGSVWISVCQMSVKTNVQRPESSMKFCLEC